MEKIKKFFILFTIIILAMTILCGTIENGLLLSILSFLAIYLFVDKIKFKHFLLFLISFSLITKIAGILLIKTPLTGDFILMYDTAKHIAKEGIHTPIHGYFNIWGYQLFHVLYEAMILKCIDSAFILKLLNVFYSTGITVFIYLIVKKLTNEKTARITSLLYTIALYPLYLNTILGNQQLALLLALAGIYLLLYKKDSRRKWILIGILLGISHLERNEGIVYVATAIFYLFLSQPNWKKNLQKSAILICTFLLTVTIPSAVVRELQINRIGFGNANPEWKFLLGFNSETYGVYDKNDEAYASDLEIQHQELIKRVLDVKKWPVLFYNKIKIQFLYASFGASFDDLNAGSTTQNLKETIFNYIRVMNFFIIVLAFYGIFKEKIKGEATFFMINFLLFFGAYMLIEISARYYYNPQVTLFILSSLGINKLLTKIEKKKRP